MNAWTYERVALLIFNQVEESLSLEYKAAAALQRDDSKRADITKDVSAMANSAGGTLIYGIREPAEKTKAHFPEAIDPVERGQASKEWLENVIQTIRPRIEGLAIHPVPIPGEPERVVYVVEIPQSSTAHQAADFRYYRRYNFMCVPMQDYEIRDVMARRQHPHIEIVCERITRSEEVSLGGVAGFRGETRTEEHPYIRAFAFNQGRKVAHYVKTRIYLPVGILNLETESTGESVTIGGEEYYRFCNSNLVREVVGSSGPPFYVSKYGDARYEPILPDLELPLKEWEIDIAAFELKRSEGARILWECYADDAPARTGEILLSDMQEAEAPGDEQGD